MVKAWRELVTIPTYEVGKPEKSPMFWWTHRADALGNQSQEIQCHHQP